MNGVERAEYIYVMLCRDKDGTEGIPAIHGPLGPLPMVCNTVKSRDLMLLSMPGLAQEIGCTLTLAEFSARKDLVVFSPSKPEPEGK